MLRFGRKEKEKWAKTEAQKKGKYSRTFESVKQERLQQEYEVAEAVYRSQIDIVKKQSKLEAKQKKKEEAAVAAETDTALAAAIEESLKLAALEDPASELQSEPVPTIVAIPPDKEGESTSAGAAVPNDEEKLQSESLRSDDNKEEGLPAIV